MNGVDFSNKLNRQNDIYRKNIADQNKAHKSEVESLKKNHEYLQKNQATSHKKQVSELENSHKKSLDRVSASQKNSLREKNQQYEKALNEFKADHQQRTDDNLREWNKKMTEVRSSFDNNLEDTKKFDERSRAQMKRNYDGSVEDIRKSSRQDLDRYISTRNQEKRESDIQFRKEKSDIIRQSDIEKNDILASELDKRNLLSKNIQDEINQNRGVATERYLKSKNSQEAKFKNMVQDVNNRVDEEITAREDKFIEKQTEDTKKKNVKFAERFADQSKKYERDLRDNEFKQRAKALSEGETAKRIQEKYKENLEDQVENQRQTQMRELFNVEKAYSKRLEDTVTNYQDEIRGMNIDHAEKTIKNENKLLEVNRKDRYAERVQREKDHHDHQVTLTHLEKQNSASASSARKQANQTINKLKENFNNSMEIAQKQSKENFELTREAMLDDKRTLEKRLHEQNSQQNAQIKSMYNEKMNKQSTGYEKRIQELELQNKMIQQNAHDTIRDIMRKTTSEIERQRKAAQESAKTQVATERAISQEKENQLNDKIKNLEANFAEKMNEQTLANRKKVKDIQFQSNERLQSEANRYKDIIDQNNKFMAREIQRLKLASDTERQRLITQYEDKIQQLQRVYSEKTNELEQFNKLNNA